MALPQSFTSTPSAARSHIAQGATDALDPLSWQILEISRVSDSGLPTLHQTLLLIGALDRGQSVSFEKSRRLTYLADAAHMVLRRALHC